MDIFWIIMVYAGLALVALCGVACIFLTLLQLPGTWLMLLMMLVISWVHGNEFSRVEIIVLIVMTLMAATGELLEFGASAVGSRQAGGTKRGAALALVGGVVGAIAGTFIILIPIVGTLVGACVGAGAGSLVGDKWAGREWKAAMTSGTGAALGKLGGTIAKVVVAGLMWVASLFALFGG